MTFGFAVNDLSGKKLFTPSGKCYVLYRIIKAGAGQNQTSYHDTGINRTSDPVPLCFIRSTTRYPPNNTPPIGCVLLGRVSNYNDVNHIITAENTYSTIYLFMPGDWVETREGKQKWGARFYDEDGEVSYCGWQKPLTIDGYVASDTNTPPALKNSNSAILMRTMGTVSFLVPAINPNLPTIFLVTATAYNGHGELLYRVLGSQGGGSSFFNNYNGHIPYIDASIYEQ